MRKHLEVGDVRFKNGDLETTIVFKGAYTSEEKDDIMEFVRDLSAKISDCILNRLEGETNHG